MEKFTCVTGAVLPLSIDNLDTDQIIPKQFLRGLDKSGLAGGCLFNLRFNADGTPNPDCVFNRPGFADAPIILAGPNFGCGSSREHAVWSLQQLGIRVVIAPSYGEIFYSNCFNNGLLAARVTPEVSQELFSLVSDTTPVQMTVDLENRTIAVAGVDRVFSFEIAARHRTMLLEGLDMVENTMKDIATVNAFRQAHEAKFPWMTRLAGRTARVLKTEA
mgnify:CR=1 FL=1